MPEGQERFYILLIFDRPENNTEGEITYATNGPRSAALQLMQEFIDRNKPPRGRKPR